MPSSLVTIQLRVGPHLMNAEDEFITMVRELFQVLRQRHFRLTVWMCFDCKCRAWCFCY